MKWLGMSLGALFFMVLCGLAVGDRAGAWSWSEGSVALHDKVPISHSLDTCRSFRQNVHVTSYGQRYVCLFQGDGLRIGTTTGHGSQAIAVASLRYDSDFRLLDGVCRAVQDCYYSAKTDRLIERRYVPGSLYLTVAVYDRVKERISSVFDPALGIIKYQFDTASPDYVSRATNGQEMYAGAYALSNNGRWLAIELIGRGVGLVDLSSGEMRRVVAPGYPYGRGLDPSEELAVSNDGKTIVLTGLGAGFWMYYVTPDCGESLVVPVPEYFWPGTRACEGISVDPNEYVDSFVAGHRPTFNDEGGQLSVDLRSYGGQSHRVKLWAAGYDGTPRLGYLALGDSFSSGEGETEDDQYLPGTDNPEEKCHVSRRSYPFLVKDMLDSFGIGMASVACSGARAEDVLGKADYSGQGGRLEDAGLDLDQQQRRIVQDQALDAFLPGRIAQGDFVRHYQPNVLTIGIGGNDAGLMGKLKACAMPGTCEWAADADGLRKSVQEIGRLYSTLVGVYQQLQSDSPGSQILAIGYPLVILPDGQCDVLTSSLLDAKEREFMDQSVRYLNQVIRAATIPAGATYVDIEESYLGHRLCDGSLAPAMNGVRTGNDFSVLPFAPMLKVIGGETFHPTPFGHSLMATSIRQQYQAPTAQPNCSVVNCATVPQTSEYWQAASGPPGTEQQFAVDVISEGHISPGASSVVTLPAKSFAPESELRVVVSPGDIAVSNSKVEEDGSVRVVIELPDDEDRQEGFYTVHIYGLSMTRQPIDIYQIVSYGAVPPDPIEETETTTEPDTEIIQETSDDLLTTGDITSEIGRVRVSVGTPDSSSGEVLGVRDERRASASNMPAGRQLMLVGATMIGIGVVSVALLLARRRRDKP